MAKHGRNCVQSSLNCGFLLVCRELDQSVQAMHLDNTGSLPELLVWIMSMQTIGDMETGLELCPPFSIAASTVHLHPLCSRHL